MWCRASSLLPPIYNIKRSTVNMYKNDSGRSVRVRVRVSASFQIAALTGGGNFLGGEGNCPGGEIRLRGECPTVIIAY